MIYSFWYVEGQQRKNVISHSDSKYIAQQEKRTSRPMTDSSSFFVIVISHYSILIGG